VRRNATTTRGNGPWFWLRPDLAAVVSIALFVGIFALRWSVGGVADSIAMLYVLPVALLALSFGFRVGLGAGLLAVSLFAVWMLATGESLSPLGWVCAVTPLLLVGALVGIATERIREANRVERHAMDVALLQREAAEINDSVLQQMAATKWLLESGHIDEAIELLEATMTTGQRLVTRVLGSNSVLGVIRDGGTRTL
jgi:K+-sensing histidine kinase KdpD